MAQRAVSSRGRGAAAPGGVAPRSFAECVRSIAPESEQADPMSVAGEFLHVLSGGQALHADAIRRAGEHP